MLAEALHRRHARCVAIQSSPRLPQAMKSRFDPTMFATVIDHHLDVAATVRAVSPYAPTHVVAGFESGVALADRLSEELGLPTNGTAQSEARRDKYLMWETIRQSGLRVAPHFRSHRLDEILQWSRQAATWPLIVKPSKSVASDKVFCCGDEMAVRRAAESIVSEPNILGDANDVVLVQEFIDGTEFVVDTVSVDGQRKVTAYWEYSRPSGHASRMGYDAMTLLPYEGERQDTLRSYVFRVLDALGIRFGPAHCEVMLVDGEPVLMEVGARLSAGVNAVLSRVCGGICQLDETADAILAPKQFLGSLSRQPALERWAVNVFLVPRQLGRLKRVNHLDALAQLPTLHSMSIQTEPGELLKRVAGRVTLIAEDGRALERDMASIRVLEAAGLFEVTTDEG